jgi:hypothetical protein
MLRRMRSTRRRSTSAKQAGRGQPELDPAAPALGQLLGVVGRAADQIADVDQLGVQGGRPGVVPADLEQVDEQLSNRSSWLCSSSADRPAGRFELAPGTRTAGRRPS